MKKQERKVGKISIDSEANIKMLLLYNENIYI